MIHDLVSFNQNYEYKEGSVNCCCVVYRENSNKITVHNSAGLSPGEDSVRVRTTIYLSEPVSVPGISLEMSRDIL